MGLRPPEHHAGHSIRTDKTPSQHKQALRSKTMRSGCLHVLLRRSRVSVPALRWPFPGTPSSHTCLSPCVSRPFLSVAFQPLLFTWEANQRGIYQTRQNILVFNSIWYVCVKQVASSSKLCFPARMLSLPAVSISACTGSSPEQVARVTADKNNTMASDSDACLLRKPDRGTDDRLRTAGS